MTITPHDLVREVVLALKAGDTDAQDRVFTPGDWPTRPNTWPVLRVMALRDRKESLGRASILFTVTTTIRITLQAWSPGQPADVGGQYADDRLWDLQRQVEIAVINNPAFNGAIQQYPTVDSQFAVDASGALQLAEMVMDIGFEYVQGPEDFYPTPTAPWEQGNVTFAAAPHTDPVGEIITIPQD